MILVIPEKAIQSRGFVLRSRLLVLGMLAALMVGVQANLSAATVTGTQTLRLEFEPVAAGRPLAREDWQDDRFSVSRLDFLVSGLALQRADGSWMEGSEWFGFLSLEKGRTRVEATGLPAEEFRAIRFRVGLDAATNKSDPAIYPQDHPLHPEVNGLYWGWMNAYVSLAIEGHWKPEDGGTRGFAYHVATEANAMMVELPVEFRGGGPVTLSISLDIGYILRGIDFAKDGEATHSREGDPLPRRLAASASQAFRVEGVSYDLFQPEKDIQAVEAAPAGTTPYRLAITQRFPRPILPQDNPLTKEGVALGERLFHDTRLSINNTQSCASCHSREHALADPRQFSTGAEGKTGKRNAMAIFNMAWHDGFFWDGRAKTLRQQVLMPVQDKVEMHETLENVTAKLEKDEAMQAAFAKAFGPAGITSDRMARALEQFILTQVSQNSKFDRAARKVAALTPEEARGLQLFTTEFDPARGLRGADCFHCHGGTLFSNHKFTNNGLVLAADDVGRMAVTGVEGDRGKFKTPSLRNIALTAPYMHDGRFKTLEEVVEHYSTGVRRTPTLDPNIAKHPEAGIQLSAEDKKALVAFLKTLTDEDFTDKDRTAPGDPKPELAQKP
jgi:cytochrome c peroxidase